MTQDEIDQGSSRSVAAYAIGTLLVAKIISEADQERATAIAADEIYVRLVAGDRPDADNWLFKPK